jgi:chaperonin GroES
MKPKPKPKTQPPQTLDQLEPVGMRILVRKDEDKTTTKGGIVLPDTVRVPVITARILAISSQVAIDSNYPLKLYDKVLVDPCCSIPASFDRDNMLFIVPVEHVVAVYRKDIKDESPVTN